MIDLKKVVDAEAEFILETFRGVLGDGRKVEPMMVVLVARDPVTGTALPELRTIPIFYDQTREGRAEAHAKATAIAIAGDAHAVLTALRTWAVLEDMPPGVPLEDSTVCAKLRADAKPLSEHPDRVEVIMLDVETREPGMPSARLMFRVVRDQGFVDLDLMQGALGVELHPGQGAVLPKESPSRMDEIAARNLAMLHVMQCQVDAAKYTDDGDLVFESRAALEARLAQEPPAQHDLGGES